MIDKGNLKAHFQELDEQLVLLGETEPRELIIYGGAALISMDILNRATVDIDVFDPQLDEGLLKAVKIIAEKHLYDENWINSTGKAFSYELPQGWKDRSIVFYRGNLLIVKTLAREDLEDLISLRPTKKELEKIKGKLISLEPDKRWAKKVEEISKTLLESQDG